jgi:hypothetical protein
MENTLVMADYFVWVMYSSYNGSFRSFKSLKNLAAFIFGSSSKGKLHEPSPK